VRLLLDSHVLLWAAQDSERLSARAVRALDDPKNELYASSASLWEIAIKLSLGKLSLRRGLDGAVAAWREAGVLELPIQWNHAQAAAELALHHKDPFDRLLLAQAKVEDLVLVSADKAFKPYKVRVLW
jgi:PIN domain nuclease of toxin-antitoxin system